MNTKIWTAPTKDDGLRDLFAGLAMQGLIINDAGYSEEMLVKKAYDYAEKLIEEKNRREK